MRAWGCDYPAPDGTGRRGDQSQKCLNGALVLVFSRKCARFAGGIAFPPRLRGRYRLLRDDEKEKASKQNQWEIAWSPVATKEPIELTGKNDLVNHGEVLQYCNLPNEQHLSK